MNKLPLRIAFLYGNPNDMSRSWTLNYLASLSGAVYIDSSLFGESFHRFVTSNSWEAQYDKSRMNMNLHDFNHRKFT